MDQEMFGFALHQLGEFFANTSFAHFTLGHLVMIIVGLLFITLAIVKHYEPLLLIPIGFGIILGNIPFAEGAGLQIGIYEEGSVLNMLYHGVLKGLYPPIIFLGIGAMTDFSSLLSTPRLMFLGAAAQLGIFGAYALALSLGFGPRQAGTISIIRWGRWSDGNFSGLKIGSGVHWPHCHSCLFLYGIGSCNTAANYETSDHQGRKTD